MIENKINNDSRIKWERMREDMRLAGVEACLLSTPVNLYYVTGQIYGGYFYLPVEGDPFFFVRRPNGLSGSNVMYIRKPEQMTAILEEHGIPKAKRLMLEGGEISFNDYQRLQNIFSPSDTVDATVMMRSLRMMKTEWEINQFRISADRHARTYAMIPQCYRADMTDLELQYEIERVMRYNGSLGIFRASGDMDIFMGSLLAGTNAGEPSPFDFALGGAGAAPSIPIGANGTPLVEGMSVMIDMAGNYTAYMTDMTRVFSIGQLPKEALKIHQVAIDIEDAIEQKAQPGMPCAELYRTAISIVEQHHLESCFMGARQQAKFVGHGIGLHINEPPVLTPRSQDELIAGMMLGIEPKFIIEGVGAVGIEDSYLVTSSGLEKITHSERSIIDLTN